MDNPLESMGRNTLTELEALDYHKRVTVYDKNGTVVMYHCKGRIQQLLDIISQSDTDVSEWKVVVDEESS